VIERAVAAPHLLHDIEIFAAAPVTIGLGQEVAFAGLILFGGAGDDMQRHSALRELVEGRDLSRRQRRCDRTRSMRDQKFYALGVISGIERNAKAFGRRGVIPHQHGIIVPLLVQAREIDHPVARNLPLDQVNRDPLHLGADHPEDFGWHGVPPNF
jgi:hypothetical protein